MAVKKGTRVQDTWKTKKWYKVVAPKIFNSKFLGETVASDESALKGRTARVSLMAVTGDVKKQNTSATFEIINVNAGNAETRLKKLQIVPSSLRRIIRKGKNRIDLSIVCETKDKQIVRIKPLLVTRSKAGNSALTALRRALDDVLRFEADKIAFDTLTNDIVYGKLQRKIRQRLNKIHPLKSVEIRSFERTTTTKPLLPVPKLEELKEERKQLTEGEKIEKKVRDITKKEAIKETKPIVTKK